MRRLHTASGITAALLVAASVTVIGGAGPAGAASSAARLMALNPGARFGGRTIVGTTNGQHLIAGSGNDTIGAYGTDETVVGGSGVDQIGAFASHVTIHGGTRSDVIYGGPDATLVSGSASDLLIDTHNDGTVRLTGDRNEVMLTGQHDHVICEPTSHDDVIYSNSSDPIDTTCRANNARLYNFTQSPPQTGFRLISARAMRGSGTNEDPFVANCGNPNEAICSVSFDDRWMPGGWGPGSVETVPAYRCPPDHPYLSSGGWAPFGTTVPPGVEIVQTSNPWAINVYIAEVSTVGRAHTVTGTYSHPIASGATNWTAFSNAYRIILHCTANSSDSYEEPHGLFGQ
jgi:hypothetical protein